VIHTNRVYGGTVNYKLFSRAAAVGINDTVSRICKVHGCGSASGGTGSVNSTELIIVGHVSCGVVYRSVGKTADVGKIKHACTAISWSCKLFTRAAAVGINDTVSRICRVHGCGSASGGTGGVNSTELIIVGHVGCGVVYRSIGKIADVGNVKHACTAVWWRCVFSDGGDAQPSACTGIYNSIRPIRITNAFHKVERVIK